MIVSNGPIVDVSLLLAMNKDQWDPEFLKAIPIMKTRSGMQVRQHLMHNLCVCVCVYRCEWKSCDLFRSVHTLNEPCLQKVISTHVLLFVSSFRVRLQATAVPTAAVRCGCVTAMDTWDR